jgi:hypothetical protein
MTKKRHRRQHRHVIEVDPAAGTPKSWNCVDCGMNTAPGVLNCTELQWAIKKLGRRWERIPIISLYGPKSEVYQVRKSVWKKARMAPTGGCLCIGCLEKRIGRRLKPKDFDPDHGFANLPGTPRLMDRHGPARIEITPHKLGLIYHRGKWYRQTDGGLGFIV